MRSFFLFVLLIWVPFANGTDRTQTLIDTQRPLRVVLGESERLIRFDGPVAFASRDVSGKYRLGEYFQLNNLGANVLVDTKQPFPPMRVEVIRRDQEHRYLLDLVFAESAAPLSDLVITQRVPEAAVTPTVELCNTANCLSDPRAQLIRFAAQWYYGPESLVTPLGGLSTQLKPARASLGTPQGLEARPVGRWHWQGFILDVFRVKNQKEREIELDPREFQGLTTGSLISAQRWRLDPAHRPGSATLVYYVRPEER